MIRVLAILAVLAGPACAQSDPTITAQRAGAMLQAAATSLADADGARDRVAALTETIRAYEEGLVAVREGLRQAARREQTLMHVLDAERERLARLLGALQSIQRAPPPLLLMHPTGPLGAARSGMMLSDITPAVASEAAVLRRQLEELAELRAVQDAAARQLSDGLRGVQTARTTLSQAIADRTDLPPRFETDPEAMAALVASSETLEGFASALRDNPAPPLSQGARRFQDARGALELPVLGTRLRGFNEADAAGVARPGLVLATSARAIVTSPWGATTRYAGPLLDYGNVVILEPDSTHLLVLAGLGDLYVSDGEIVAQGQAVGLMGGAAPTSEELIVTNAQDTGTSLPETLYIEVRQSGDPVDPGDWFRTDRDEE